MILVDLNRAVIIGGPSKGKFFGSARIKKLHGNAFTLKNLSEPSSFFFAPVPFLSVPYPKPAVVLTGLKFMMSLSFTFTRATMASPLRFYNINVQINLSCCKSLIKEQNPICDRY